MRYEAQRAHLAVPQAEPWVVFDHNELRALRTNGGRIIRFESEGEALRLAALMNTRVVN